MKFFIPPHSSSGTSHSRLSPALILAIVGCSEYRSKHCQYDFQLLGTILSGDSVLVFIDMAVQMFLKTQSSPSSSPRQTSRGITPRPMIPSK